MDVNTTNIFFLLQASYLLIDTIYVWNFDFNRQKKTPYTPRWDLVAIQFHIHQWNKYRLEWKLVMIVCFSFSLLFISFRLLILSWSLSSCILFLIYFLRNSFVFRYRWAGGNIDYMYIEKLLTYTLH